MELLIKVILIFGAALTIIFGVISAVSARKRWDIHRYGGGEFSDYLWPGEVSLKGGYFSWIIKLVLCLIIVDCAFTLTFILSVLMAAALAMACLGMTTNLLLYIIAGLAFGVIGSVLACIGSCVLDRFEEYLLSFAEFIVKRQAEYKRKAGCNLSFQSQATD